jgi:hypothetical protein
MKYVGIDLRKKTISGCVVIKERGKKKVAARKRLECRDEAGIKSWFSELCARRKPCQSQNPRHLRTKP